MSTFLFSYRNVKFEELNTNKEVKVLDENCVGPVGCSQQMRMWLGNGD